MSTSAARACLPPLRTKPRSFTFAELAPFFANLAPVRPVEAQFQLIKCAVGCLPSFAVIPVTAYPGLIDEMALSEIGNNEGVQFEATGDTGHWIAQGTNATYHLFRIL